MGDGVTMLGVEGNNLLAFILLISFLRPHQELKLDVDFQSGRVHGIKGPGGMEWCPTPDQFLLIEDMEHINALRNAISDGFYSGPSVVPQTVEKEDGIDFTGTRGKRDNEPVPQIASDLKVADCLDNLLKVLREVSVRVHNWGPEKEAAWNSRHILQKPLRKIVDMHGGSRSSTDEANKFCLFRPFADLLHEKRATEWQQAEQEEGIRRKKEEDRRRKEEEKRIRDDGKRQKKMEEKQE